MNGYRRDMGGKMECLACHSEIQKGTEYCNCCGFPMFFPIVEVAGDMQKESIPVRAGRSYLKERLEGLQISMRTYYYQLKENVLTLDHEEEILLARGEELSHGEIRWNETDFLRIESMETLILELIIRQGKKVNRCTVTVQNPGGRDYWHMGVLLQSSLRAQIVIGSLNFSTCSEEFSILI